MKIHAGLREVKPLIDVQGWSYVQPLAVAVMHLTLGQSQPKRKEVEATNTNF
jgi:hypothetical protein